MSIPCFDRPSANPRGFFLREIIRGITLGKSYKPNVNKFLKNRQNKFFYGHLFSYICILPSLIPVQSMCLSKLQLAWLLRIASAPDRPVKIYDILDEDQSDIQVLLEEGLIIGLEHHYITTTAGDAMVYDLCHQKSNINGSEYQS